MHKQKAVTREDLEKKIKAHQSGIESNRRDIAALDEYYDTRNMELIRSIEWRKKQIEALEDGLKKSEEKR